MGAQAELVRRCTAVLGVILVAVEAQTAIIEESERFEREFTEPINKKADQATKDADKKAKEILEYDGPRACEGELVDKNKVKAAVRQLTNEMTSKYVIDKPINDVVLEFLENMKKACLTEEPCLRNPSCNPPELF